MNPEAYKAYAKLRVIIFMIVLYTCVIGVLSSITWWLLHTVVGIYTPYIWQCDWWQIIAFLFIMYVYSAIMYGVILGVKAVIIRNKDSFFLR